MILLAFLNFFLGILLLFLAGLSYFQKNSKQIIIPDPEPEPEPDSGPGPDMYVYNYQNQNVISYMDYDPYAPAPELPDNCIEGEYCGPPYTRPQKMCNVISNNNKRGCTEFIKFSNIDSTTVFIFLQGATKVKFFKKRKLEDGNDIEEICDDSTYDLYTTTCNSLEGITLSKNYESAEVIEDGANGYPKGVGVVAVYGSSPDPFIFRKADHFEWDDIDKVALTINNKNSVDLNYLNIQVYNPDGTINVDENFQGLNSTLFKAVIDQDLSPVNESSLWNEALSIGAKSDLNTLEDIEVRFYENVDDTIDAHSELYISDHDVSIKGNSYSKIFVYNKQSNVPNENLF